MAPTPSGYLHLGNAWSFLYTWLWTRSQKGQLYLRVDAMDAERMRPDFIEDIRTSLDWLGLDWDGVFPASLEALQTGEASGEPPLFSEALKKGILQSQSPEKGWAFACHCSREQIKKVIQEQGLPSGIYPGTCRHRKITTWEDAQKAPVIRWHIPETLTVTYLEEGHGWQSTRAAEVSGDIILRTRSGHIAYHLGSLASDQFLEITHIVRGQDLQPSTVGQLALAQAMGFPGFASVRFVHHPLITEAHRKLSKSQGSPSLQAMRSRGVSPRVIWTYFAKTMGLPLEAGQSLKDLLILFPEGQMPKSHLPFEEFSP
jgi:glutamyl/glutaminyl-tRNA synthetase